MDSSGGVSWFLHQSLFCEPDLPEELEDVVRSEDRQSSCSWAKHLASGTSLITQAELGRQQCVGGLWHPFITSSFDFSQDLC